MSALPKGWASTTLKDVGSITTGGTPSTKAPEFYGGSIPFVKPSDLDRSEPIFETEQQLSELGAAESRMLRKGAVLVSCIGNLGKVGVAGTELATNQQINSVEFDSTIVNDRYGYFVCRTLKPWMERESSATTIAILNKGRFSEAPFPLAPLPEQKRIADKLDATLARVDACRARLERIQPILKRFRQSVLAAATSGQLTADWREQQGYGHVGNDEKELQGNTHAGQLYQTSPNSTNLSDNAYGSSDLCAQMADFSSKWKRAVLGDVILDLRYGTSKKCDYSDAGEVVLRIPNMADKWKLDLADVKRAEFTQAEIEKLKLVKGDLLLIRSNGSVDLVGKTCLVTEQEEGVLFAGYLMRMRVARAVVMPEYVCLSMSGPELRAVIESTSKSTSGVNNINSDEVKGLPINLPSIEEQTEIVRRVETLFTFADRLEARLASATAAAERLTPSLLAKAFRGELVPQDPTDEPASELLKRLAEQREAAGSKPKRSKKAAA